MSIPRANDAANQSGEIRSIRILPELRAVQVERATHMTPARTIYLGEKYDLGKTVLPPSMIKLTLPETVIDLLRANETVLELPEPLWLRFLPKAVVFSLAWKLGGLLRGRRRQTVTYAIENNDVEAVLFGRRRSQKIVSRLLRGALRILIMLSYDRIAFGSEGARKSYESLGLGRKVETRAWNELPAATQASQPKTESGGAIFVGRLEERKGIQLLISAWNEVEKNLPGTKLTIVGGGELEEIVDSWRTARPESRVWIGEVEHNAVSDLLLANNVLVAPSIRWGRWREQIGLPIGEGLQAGLTIVTTDESGLAAWLEEHGHQVIPAERVSSQLGQAIVRALTQPIPVEIVRNSLPALSGRIAADRWLHNPLSAVGTPSDIINTEPTGSRA